MTRHTIVSLATAALLLGAVGCSGTADSGITGQAQPESELPGALAVTYDGHVLTIEERRQGVLPDEFKDAASWETEHGRALRRLERGEDPHHLVGGGDWADPDIVVYLPAVIPGDFDMTLGYVATSTETWVLYPPEAWGPKPEITVGEATATGIDGVAYLPGRRYGETASIRTREAAPPEDGSPDWYPDLNELIADPETTKEDLDAFFDEHPEAVAALSGGTGTQILISYPGMPPTTGR